MKFAPDNHLLLGHSHFHHQACFTHHLPERERDVPRRPLSSKSFNAFAEMDVQKNIFSCASLTHTVKHSLVVYQWSVDGRPQSWSNVFFQLTAGPLGNCLSRITDREVPCSPSADSFFFLPSLSSIHLFSPPLSFNLPHSPAPLYPSSLCLKSLFPPDFVSKVIEEVLAIDEKRLSIDERN